MHSEFCYCKACDSDDDKLVPLANDRFAYHATMKKALIDSGVLNSVLEAIKDPLIPLADEHYELGYAHGLANTKDSILWSRSKLYKMGWADGEGDRLYS